MAKGDLSPAVLRELFSYDEATGQLCWRAETQPDGGARARIRPNGGYLRVRVFGSSRLVHRACWIIARGDIPAGMTIDHINGDKLDNRLCNLRLASVAENNQNIRTARAHSKTGIQGVSKTRSGTWRARIGIGGKQKVVGTYKTAEEASAAFIQAKRLLHPGFAG